MGTVVLIDNGHGADTRGKRSPDGRLREFRWCRDCAKRMAEALEADGIKCVLVVPELTDVPLSVRTARVRALCRENGGDCILVSVHVNASTSRGDWAGAHGWSAYVAKNASSRSKRLASTLTRHAVGAGLRGNRSTPNAGYWVGNFAIIRDVPCPSVLTENMFMDNKADCEYLLTAKSVEDIAMMHAEAIKEYLYG